MTEQSILQTVAEATRLREGAAGVSAVLRAVYRAGSLRLQEAAREARLPLPVASAVRRELEKAGLLERKHGLSLTEMGRNFVERNLGLGKIVDLICPTCAGQGLVIPPEYRSLVDRLSEILAGAPPIDVTLDQAPCTPATAILRALLMLQVGALEGRRVLLLGDDDSVSIAIGLLARAFGRDDLTQRLTVLDIDERWLSFLQRAAETEKYTIEIMKHDLRQPLPDSLRHSFDTVETDPPYTLEGAQLFLGRAQDAMANNATGHCFFSFAHWPPPQMLELQQVMTDLGFAIQTVRPDFNHYAGASVLGNVGQLFELVQLVPSASEKGAWSGPLYTAQVNPRSRVYICANCGTKVTLGENGASDTIEALKAKGCTVCGEHTFRRQASGSPHAYV